MERNVRDRLRHLLPFFVTAFMLLFAAMAVCAAEIPLAGGIADYSDSLIALPQAQQSDPLEQDSSTPDAIQNRPYNAVSANIPLQRHRYRSSASSSVEQLSLAEVVQDNASGLAAYLTSLKSENFVLSPITCAKITHKRE